MDSFFGIGPLELIFILIFALIFLGPERLPGAVRQIASFIRQIQKLSSTLTQQLGDEFGDIRELDPRYQLQQMMDEPDEKEAAKQAEEKKKEEEKKKAEAKKAEEKRQAEAKKKAEEAKKTAEAARAAVAAKAAAAAHQKGEDPAATPPEGQTEAISAAVAEDTQVAQVASVLPPTTVTDSTDASEQKSGADVENTIAPPIHTNHVSDDGSLNGAVETTAQSPTTEVAASAVVKEEEA